MLTGRQASLVLIIAPYFYSPSIFTVTDDPQRMVAKGVHTLSDETMPRVHTADWSVAS